MEQNEIRNATKKKLFPLLFLGVVVIAIIAAVLVSRYIREKNSEVLLNIWKEYTAGEYENVLTLAEAAPEPYGSYYKKLMSYRVKLDSWQGTERELYEWLLTFMEQMDIEAIPENPYSDDEHLFSMIRLTTNKEELEKGKEWIENEFVWYPEFYQIRVEFYQKYFMLLIENRELFNSAPNDGVVSISTEDMVRLDLQMNKLLSDSIRALDELQEKYNIVEDEEHNTITREKQAMKTCKKDYDEYGAVSSIYDLDGKEYIHIYEEAAVNNYEVLRKGIRLLFGSWGVIESLNSDHPFNGLFGVPKEYWDRKGPIEEVLLIVYEIFPDSTLSLSESEYASVYDVIYDYIDDYIGD